MISVGFVSCIYSCMCYVYVLISEMSICNYRCESLNSILRGFNVHGNRQAPSRDIGRAFATGTVLHALASSSSANPEG